MVHDLIVHVFHVRIYVPETCATCTFVHIYTWRMCVPMELSTDCKLLGSSTLFACVMSVHISGEEGEEVIRRE